VRYNVLSALDLASKKLTTVTNDTYITATQFCELLKKIAVEYAGQPVYLTLDSVRYQKCKLVQEFTDQLGIILYIYIYIYIGLQPQLEPD
jgi:hypothetical protein